MIHVLGPVIFGRDCPGWDFVLLQKTPRFVAWRHKLFEQFVMKNQTNSERYSSPLLPGRHYEHLELIRQYIANNSNDKNLGDKYVQRRKHQTWLNPFLVEDIGYREGSRTLEELLPRT